MDLYRTAKSYKDKGFSIIPIRPGDKKPLIKWEKYQKEIASDEQLEQWFTQWPRANLAVVTGSISGFCVVDIDSNKADIAFLSLIDKECIGPVATTPSGGKHYYFLDQGLGNATGIMLNVDFRGEGGYVLVPPSIIDGIPYGWDKGFNREALNRLPNSISTLISSSRTRAREGGGIQMTDEVTSKPKDIEQYSVPTKPKEKYAWGGDPGSVTSRDQAVTEPGRAVTSVTRDVKILFTKGYRDETLFHIANYLNRGGMGEGSIGKVIDQLAKSCQPPFSLKEASEKVQSAIKHKDRGERSWQGEIEEWVNDTTGWWTYQELDRDLKIESKQERTARRKVIQRLVENSIIQKHPTKSNMCRKIDLQMEAIDLSVDPGPGENLVLPLGLSEIVKIYPGNIIIFAGEPNAGKTTLLLNILADNITKYKCTFFSSAEGSEELALRVRAFEDIDWHTIADNADLYERSGNFADVIIPGRGNLNIIDYLEIHEDHYKIGAWINDIHRKLRGAICVIALQKRSKVEHGIGGEVSLEKPRLYCSVTRGKLKILKAKIFKNPKFNPNGYSKTFNLIGGWKLRATSKWFMEDETKK